MSTPQWVATLSLALEIPFDSTEDSLWSTLLAKHVKFTEIFITTLTTIDIVRLPFIDYSFIKWFVLDSNSNKETIFMAIQANVFNKNYFPYKNRTKSNSYQTLQNLNRKQLT